MCLFRGCEFSRDGSSGDARFPLRRAAGGSVLLEGRLKNTPRIRLWLGTWLAEQRMCVRSSRGLGARRYRGGAAEGYESFGVASPTFKVNRGGWFPRRVIAADPDRIVLVPQVRSLIPRWPTGRAKNNLSTGPCWYGCFSSPLLSLVRRTLPDRSPRCAITVRLTDNGARSGVCYRSAARKAAAMARTSERMRGDPSASSSLDF